MDGMENWRSYATMCRLCLQKDGFMLGIFNHIQGKDKSIYKKIMDCTALQISVGDGLPNVICHRCLFKIEFCLEFRQLCFVSDATLRQINGVANKDAESGSNTPHVPFYEQLATGSEDVVMVVDPSAMDYDSEYESDNNERQSDENVEINEGYDNKNVSMCKFCDHAFTDKAECTLHENTAHNLEVPYACAECSMDFGDRLQYSAHLKNVHQNEKPYNCPQCHRTFARRSDLRKHTIVHTGIKPYTCTVCFKSFSRNTNLSKHMRIHLSRKPFVCPKCPKSFTSKAELTRHTAVHFGNKPFGCNYCPMSFERKDKLQRHEKRHFPQENAEDKSQELQMLRENLMGDYSYVAPPANDSENNNDQDKDGWASSENMVINVDPFNHNNLEITPKSEPLSESDANAPDFGLLGDQNTDTAYHDVNGLPPVPEHITGDSFAKAALENSMRLETENSKTYSCQTCSKSFSSKENLRYHRASHSGVRPFVCNTCNKSFVRKRELDRHIVTHSGMKPFKCTKCSKSFGRKDKLIRHMRIHDVNRHHACSICKATFNRRDTLAQHIKTHHRKETE